jgi:hypothetical protein
MCDIGVRLMRFGQLIIVMQMCVMCLLPGATLKAQATEHSSQVKVLYTQRYPQRGTKVDPLGAFDPEQGTAEFWIKPLFDPATVKDNQFILSVRYGNGNSVGLYFNAAEKALIYYMMDADDPRQDFHSRQYPVFINAGKVDWQKDEQHHVTITWSAQVSRLYLDGKEHRRSFFHGGIKVDAQASSKREMIIGEGQYEIQAARVWSLPRAPRRIDRLPVATDARALQFPDHLPAWPQDQNQMHAGRLRLAVNSQQKPVALAIDQKSNNWMHKPLALLANTSLTSQWQASANQNGNTVTLSLTLNNPTDKHIETDVTVSWPILQPNMHVFFPAGDCPFVLEEGRTFYDHSRAASPVLPMVTVYQPQADLGLTITSSDQTQERVTIDAASEGDATDLRITHEKMQFSPGQSRTITWYLVGHEGDWRPGLQAYAQLFPAILNKPVGPITKVPQGMIIGGPSDDDFLGNLVDMHIGWREVSLNLGKGAGFGNYVPDDLKPYEHAVEMYRKANASMNRHGIVPLMYIQARECKDVARAESDFSDSVVRYQDGSPVVDQYGPFGATMTCVPGTAWFEHLKDQAYREMKVFDQAGGFFFDNAWRTDYAPIMNAIADIAHGMGKSLASNGANAMSVGYSDNIMAESHYQALDELQYLGLVTPVTYIPIYATGVLDQKEREMIAPGLLENLLVDLKHCLKSGAFYSLNYRGTRYWSDGSLNLYRQYLPMQEMLNGRQWLLHAHALDLPESVLGNVFERAEGQWLVTLTTPMDAPHGTQLKPERPVVLRMPANMPAFTAARFRDINSRDWQELKLTVKHETVLIEVPAFTDMAVIELSQNATQLR